MLQSREKAMAELARSRGSVWNWGAGIVALLVVGAAIGLWARHGAAVFFDMLTAGLAYCF
ncbi:hypothetical protein EJV44_18880 [Ancylobacter aquaticus]|nr:hypothetical protein EJV44_18880 [Ancylobacter aquaticus]